ncbi:hypothetical protein SAMD00019534_049240 [Acytostelium subglobosum LB1]|uniref:hypothetical protein n=1 Tax=Acytostelium subglobosum LB1 TaxID=1410327 RepID=UPI000644F375|nr:hypothetical protein SAMD00019534_049240 [Acytostelium subglobosum LB1]GAM21749.1 hypothetical protein SAMD00019534_049240 [Acytostelium subglobosum LB1]|eukprot:XP_012754849.1 hypothetical protein SAMD00019534_049240 [Acytostelium subglobosum LB1]
MWGLKGSSITHADILQSLNVYIQPVHDLSEVVLVKIPQITIDYIITNHPKDPAVSEYVSFSSRSGKTAKPTFETGDTLEIAFSNNTLIKLRKSQEFLIDPPRITFPITIPFPFLQHTFAHDIQFTIMDFSCKSFPIFNSQIHDYNKEKIATLLERSAYEPAPFSSPDIQVSNSHFANVIETSRQFVLYKCGPKSSSSDFYIKLSESLILSFIIKSTISITQLAEEVNKAVPDDSDEINCICVVVALNPSLSLEARADLYEDTNSHILLRPGVRLCKGTKIKDSIQVVILKPSALEDLFSTTIWRSLVTFTLAQKGYLKIGVPAPHSPAY